MRSRVTVLIALLGLVVASCGSGASTETAPVDVATTGSPSTTAQEAKAAETAPFHAIQEDSVWVTGTATCEFSQEGVDPTGGDSNDFVTCELNLSDPRVSGTETHDRLRYFYTEGDEVGMWVVEEGIITNSEGTWRGTAQAVDDGTPMGEARYVGEGAYDGLTFHYYFGDVQVGEALVHGWISSDE